MSSKSNKIAALIIGRGNNTLENKNILKVHGRPLLQWGALAAKNSEHIGRYYISSDCDKILEAGAAVDFVKIKRPDYLALPDSQSADAVKHAYEVIAKEGEIETLIVIHANVGTISSDLIDSCIAIKNSNKDISAVIPSHRKDEYHPLRARKLNSDGTMEPYVGKPTDKISANRQELPTCLFFDHSFWVLDVEKGVKAVNGQEPWPVMGSTIVPFETEGCFDVHDLEDLKKTEDWITENRIEAAYQSNGLL